MATKQTAKVEAEDVFNFDDATIEDVVTGTETTDITGPLLDRTSPEWTTFVLSHLVEDEIFNGRPTVDGLRRLVEVFVGRIVESKIKVYQTPTKDNGYSCTVNVSVTVAIPKLSELADSTLDTATYIYQSGVGHADINNNTTEPFAKYNVTIAETRAEGRIFKKLLGLKKTITAEELQGQPELGIIDSNPNINDTQISTIDIIAKRLDINVRKLILTYYKVKHINSLTHNQAINIIKKLSEYQQEITNISNDIKKYDSNWKGTFYAV